MKAGKGERGGAQAATGRGRFIVVEGTEGAGKSTQVARLAAAMRESGVDVEVVREPGATQLGEEVRKILLADHEIDPRAELFLFLAARAQLIPELRKWLAGGKTVIADRFFLSTYAYQVAGRGLPADVVRSANALATDGLMPDLTVILVVPPAHGLKRKDHAGTHRDRIEQAGIDFHERVASAFSSAVTAEWQRGHPECGPIVAIDGIGSEAEVTGRIMAVVGAGQHGKRG
jgi:dTMP kinase